jgi:photosystem II stability/assembly factor-like uncharacterized protein
MPQALRPRHHDTVVRFLACFVFLSILPAVPIRAQQLSDDLLHGLSWRLIGTYRGGRVTAVSGIAGDPKTYYMGTPGGGVWKTTNGGVTWNPIFDEAHVASIGDLVVAPSNPNVIYVATGEQTPGNGVWKSSDAGATWSNIGIRDSHTIPSLLVDPHNADIVYVAAMGGFTPSESRGIYKSIDGGKSWRKVFFKDDRTNATELCFDPSNSRILYAVIRPIPPDRGEKPPEGVDTTILKSTDAGETWSPLEEKGLPTERRGRIGLAVAPAPSTNRIFALMRQGLFRSNDAGANWQKITDDPRILGSEYFGRVYSDPRNPDVVYVMQTSTYRSGDGGHTFAAWKGTPSGEDDHVLWIAPEDTSRIIMGTDQGAVVTLDGGKIWNSWFNQPTGQFYRVSTDNFFPYRLYAPQQDSGSVVVPFRSDFGQISYRDWFPSGAFESGFIAPDPVNPNFVYSVGWYGTVLRRDRSTGQLLTLFVPPANYRVAWETPLVFSPRDPRTLYYGSQFVLKTSDGGFTWKETSGDLTTKAGETPPQPPKGAAGGHVPSKENVDSDDAADGDDVDAQAPARGAIQTIAPSPLDANLIWVGSATGLIHVTHDGTSWTDITPPGLPERSTINAIEASPNDANTAYAAIFARRDDHPYFFRTRDGGKTWEKIVSGIPDFGVARAIREDPVRKGLLFAGTEFGVYASFDSGDHWQPLELNLPAASVRDLTIHGAELVAATFGRGLWILDDISPLRQISTDVSAAPVRFFVPTAAVRARWDNDPDTPLQPGTPLAQNPPDGAILYYFFNSPPKGEITLDVLDSQGTRVAHFSNVPAKESTFPANVPEFWFYPPAALPISAGINRFVWDLRYPHPVALPYGYFGERLAYTEYSLPDHAVPGATPRFQPPGPLAAPGKYDLVLTVEGKTYRQKLDVLPDPRVSMTAADYSDQLNLSLQLYDWMDATAKSFDAVALVQRQLDERKKSVPASAPKELTDAVSDLEKQLKLLSDGTRETPGFGPLNRDLGRNLVMVQSGDVRPTESAHASALASCKGFASKTTELNKVLGETVPALNKLFIAQSLAPLTVTVPSAGPSCAP